MFNAKKMTAMKKKMTMALMMTIAITANAMNYTDARREALFLSDKMAYELNLTDAQYDAVYEINLDYLMSVNMASDVLGPWWSRRDADLRYVLSSSQYARYAALGYFYRPLAWNAGTWTMHIYARYTDHNRFFHTRPTVYVSYRGGNNHHAASAYAGRTFHAQYAPKPAASHTSMLNHRPAAQPQPAHHQQASTRTSGAVRQQPTHSESARRSFGAHR